MMSSSGTHPSITADFRLKGYYYAAQVSGLIVTFVLGVLVYFFPDYFLYVLRPHLIALLFFGICAANAVCFILRETTGAKFFWQLNRWLWIFFFLAFVYVTGAVTSRYLFLLVFPLLVSAVDLEAEATRRVGIALTAGFGLMLFANPSYYHTPLIISEHVVRTAVFAIIAYYVHKIVKETLRQKYEKEETSRRFVELIELDKVKTDFLTVAQHQLRTPLAGARWGLSNVLLEKGVPEDSRQILGEVAHKIEDAVSIVNEMLKAAELKAGGFRMEKKELDIAALLASTVNDLRYLINQKQVTLTFDKHKEIFLVSGDAALLKAAFSNIIDNAIRYTPGGNVEIVVAPSGGQVIITVKDSGIGIKAEDLPYVFDRFYRGKNAIKVDPNESGVGLYTARKLIELHGGTIALHSTSDKGTTVTVTLPVV